MQKIPLKLTKPGMVLEKPILRDNGLVLVAQGTEITETLLNRLESMGVKNITVEGSPVKMEGVEPPKTYEQRIEELDHLFRKYKDDQWMNKMKEFVRSYFERKLAAQKKVVLTDAQSDSAEDTSAGEK